VFFATDGDYTVLANKPDRIHIKKSAPSKQATGLSHDREKQYILREDVPNAMLEQLGVMTPSGKVVAKYRDKFKQINRFLEIVRDCLPFLPENPLIVDFGCGKSYLTFAMYHYLNEQLNLGARFVGLDLKHDVIAFCSETARALGYSDLQFLVGDIAEYAEHDRVDMVVTLHACDKATDEALIKAVEWDADVILSVPCCQHELFPQLAQPAQNAILQHGLLKERFASILTDALRAQALQYSGYSVAAIEFIDMEHTPKNLMLRCNRKPIDDAHAAGLREEFLSLCAYWNVQPSIARLLEMRRIP
jgi:SAM-dependent methyltransferase